MNWRRILILAGFDLRYSIFKLKGLLFLLPFVLYWSSIFKLLYEGGRDFIVSQQGLLISTFVLAPETTHYLFIQQPASLSVCYLMALTMMPAFVMLAGNNQLAGDAGRNSFRYLLTRCSRTELFISRFLACFYLLAITLVLFGIAAWILSMEIDQFALTDTFQYVVRIVATLLVYSLPLIAFMSLFSALLSSALAALLTSAICYFFLLVMTFWLRDDYSWAEYLLPGGMKSSLYGMSTTDLFTACATLIGYTLAYGLIGWTLFRRRGL